MLSQSNWTDAENFAHTLDGHLVTISSEPENRYLFLQFTRDLRDSIGLWIGLNDSEQEGVFTWTNGEALTYTNWAPAFGGPPEPNNFHGIEDYVHLLWTGDPRAGKWNDAPNAPAPFGVPMHGIVEVPHVQVNEPNALLLITTAILIGLAAVGKLQKVY